MTTDKSEQPPKPGPELQRLAPLMGTWKVEGERRTAWQAPPVWSPVKKHFIGWTAAISW